MSSQGRLPIGDAWEAPTAKKAKAKRAPKAKPACKYGPRDADGRCPKKPRKGTTPRVGKTVTAATRRLETKATNAIVRGAQEGLSSVATQVAAKGGIKAATKETLNKSIPVIGGVATTVGKALGVAAVAGVAAFIATTAIIRAHKTYDDQVRAAKANAADAFRRARLEYEAMVGRSATLPEIKTLYAYFQSKLKQQLDELNRTPKGIGS